MLLFFIKDTRLSAKYDKPALMIDNTGKVVTTFPKDLSYIDNATPPAGIFGGDRPDYPFYVSETLKQLVDEGRDIFHMA